MFKPRYRITDQLLNKIAQIEAMLSQVSSSFILPEREIEMRQRATVEATHSSTSIEGNPLNAKQVEKILFGKNPLTRHQYAEIEVKNYKKAIDFVDKRKTIDRKLTTQDILEIHGTVMEGLLDSEKVGVWRKNPVYIENQDGQVVYSGPSAALVPREIDGLLDWLNVESYEVHPVIAAAILHLQLVSVHPFADGNGRTARILTALYLGLRGYDFRGSLVLDSYYSADKKAYYSALHVVQGKNYSTAKTVDLNPWLDYFTEGFLSSATVLSAEVMLLSSFVKGTPTKRKLSRDETDLLSYVKYFGPITLSEAETVLPNVPRRTVQRRLKNLVDVGYLKSTGTTSDTKYTIAS